MRRGNALSATLTALALWVPASAQEPQEPVARVPGDPAVRLDPALRQRLALWDPAADDWESEVFHDAAKKRFAELKKLLTGTPAPSADALAPLLADGFVTAALVPAAVDLRFDDGDFRVHAAAAVEESAAAWSGEGAGGLAEALAVVHARFGENGPRRVKLKIDGLQIDGDRVRSRARFLAEGPSPEGLRLMRAVWICSWQRQADGPPLLLALRAETWSETLLPGRSVPLFRDVTLSAFADPDTVTAQLGPGLDHWLGRLPAGIGFSDRSHQGIAVADVDGDGREDLFLPQPAGLPNRLYLRRADGLLEDATAAAGLDILEGTRAALFLDLDNDGDQDLVVSARAELLFLENDGEARFRVRLSGEAAETTMLTAADYDGDGLLDVYACRYLNPYDGQAIPTPYHDADNGLDNALLRNLGDFRFLDVTDEVGMDANNGRFSFAAAWEDYDDDGDQDLYVANDFGRNNLYRNDGGRFVDVASEAGVEDVAASMGVSWADYDGDGLMDLYVSNMDSGAGKRIAFQQRFQSEAGAELLQELQRHARGNSLFRNRGDGSFEDVSESARVTEGLWAWGAVFTDFGNDGRPDLFVPNGFLTNRRDDDL
jgi:hypothetical protein